MNRTRYAVLKTKRFTVEVSRNFCGYYNISVFDSLNPSNGYTVHDCNYKKANKRAAEIMMNLVKGV